MAIRSTEHFSDSRSFSLFKPCSLAERTGIKLSLIFKHRSKQKEILDDFGLQGNDLRQNLRELQLVNTRLGGYSIVKEGIGTILKNKKLTEPVRVADIGCGGGDTLREVARWGRDVGVELKLTGIDANSNAIAFSEEQSSDFPEIQFCQVNIFSDEFKALDYDIVMFNLFAHHFEEEEIREFLNVCKHKQAVILINDLQRSAVAYALFGVSSKVLHFSRISRHDGMLSIRKGFTRTEWRRILEEVGFTNFTIRWRWAFRYQVIAY